MAKYCPRNSSLIKVPRRKRFKRVFEKDDEPIVLKGSILGNPDDAKPTPKTQRTPKAKLAKSTSDGDETEPTPADGNKKRKATEAESEEDDGKNEAGNYQNSIPPRLDHNVGTENTAAPGSPTKKPRATVKAPRTPKTPKTPKIPKTPQTPRSGAQAKASSKTEVTTADADEEADKTPQISEPAVQAKADAAVKETESAGGFTMGDPERQAKQDAVKASLSN